MRTSSKTWSFPVIVCCFLSVYRHKVTTLLRGMVNQIFVLLAYWLNKKIVLYPVRKVVYSYWHISNWAFKTGVWSGCSMSIHKYAQFINMHKLCEQNLVKCR